MTGRWTSRRACAIVVGAALAACAAPGGGGARRAHGGRRAQPAAARGRHRPRDARRDACRLPRRARHRGAASPAPGGWSSRARVRAVEGIAARGALTPSRLAPLTLTLERNREWWTTRELLPNGARVTFPGSELVWQMFSGQGLQFHPLANFGTLNGLYAGGRRNDARADLLMTELLGMAVRARRRRRVGVLLRLRGRAAAVGERALAGHGAAGAHARGDAARAPGGGLPRSPRAASACSSAPTPSGVRVATPDGPHYALYSFAPGLRVANGFVYSLVGLYDYAQPDGRPARPRAVRRRQRHRARRRAPLRHRRLVAVRARDHHARVRPQLPRAPARLPDPALRPHGRPRLLHGGVALHDLPRPSRRR